MQTCDYCDTRATWLVRCGCGITCLAKCACTKHIGKGAKQVMSACKWYDDGVRLDKYEESE